MKIARTPELLNLFRQSLLDEIKDMFECDDEMAHKVVAYLNNEDDDEVDSMLYEHFHEHMPYGTAKARTGDPYNWIADRMSDLFKDYM